MQQNISFTELISKYTILIPKIQRDYAQGRTDKKTSDIRESFLEEIIKRLDSDSNDQLVLDFIYGSTTENGIFIPLDGQQRLTTLFLLHWYLCPTNELSVLQHISEKLTSKLTYETRLSSKDFCNILVQHSLPEVKASLYSMVQNSDSRKKNNLSDAIINEPWFLWSWRKDPTIKGILVMLDAIDEKVISADSLWKRLTSQKKIIFHMLPLEKFNLTSELYVKMNSRGKELSSFDILKSMLEEQMKRNNTDEVLQHEWSNSIDNKWMDLFWSKIAIPHFEDNSIRKETNIIQEVENSYLKFLKRMMFFHLYLINDFTYADKIDKTIYPQGIKTIREYVSRNDILSIVPQLIKYGFYEQSLFSFINETMKQFISSEDININSLSDFVCIELWNSDIPSNNLFDLFIFDKITYSGRALFFGLIQYSKYFSAEEVKQNQSYQIEVNAWMRILRNLIHNTAFDSPEFFLNILNEIESLASNIYATDRYRRSVLSYFASNGTVNRFTRDQVLEEQEKARRILALNSNSESIYEMENYAFFRGCIRFLFTDRNGEYDWSLFEERAVKVEEYFDKNGVKSAYRENARLICSLISLFTKWEQCWGNNKIRIGNGVEVWSYIIRNRNLQQSLSDLLDLDRIPLSTQEGFTSQIESFDIGYEEQERLTHEDICNNGLISEAINIMGEGILLNWKYNQFALYRPNANADWKKYVIGNKRNEVLCDLRSRGIITSDQNISGKPYFWGWNIDFKLETKDFRWNTNDKLCLYDLESQSYLEIEDANLISIEQYLNSVRSGT